MSWQKKVLVNLNVAQQRLSSVRSRKEVESEHNFRRLMGHCKCINIQIMGVLEGEEQKRKKNKGKKNIKRNNDRKHHKLAEKNINLCIKETQYTPSRLNPNIDKSQTSKSNLDIIVKFMKVKDKS